MATATDEATAAAPKRRRAPASPRPRRDQGKIPVSKMLAESGVSGTKNFAGIIQDEYLSALGPYQFPIVYDQMRRSDATVRALLAAYQMPIRSSKWYVQPYDDSPDSVRMADFMHDNLWSYGDQTFDSFLREALNYLTFGFSCFEKVFDWMEGEWEGKLGWFKFGYRYPNTRFRWNFENQYGAGGVVHRRFKSMTQLAPPDYRLTDIPAEKLIVFSHDKEGDNLDGISLLRAVYKHWLIKDILYKIQGIGLERASVGVPYARYLMDVAPATITYVQNMLQNLRIDDQAYVAFDGNEVEIGFLDGKFNAQALQLAIEHHDDLIIKSGLAQFVNLGTRSSGTTGSYALSEAQSQMFLDALNGEANYLASEFHMQATIQLLEYNFPNVDRSKMPRLAHGDIGQRAINNMAMALNAFAQYGFLSPDPRTENVIRAVMDLPERDEDYFMQQALDSLEATTHNNQDILNSKQQDKGNTPAQGQQQQQNAGQSSGGTGSQIKRNVAPRPKMRNKSVAGAQTGASSVANMSEKEREQVYVTYMSELEAMKNTALGWRPERPSEKAARLRRPYEIRSA